MRRKKAFAVTLEMILVLLICVTVGGICLAAFTDNLSVLFHSSRNYKQIFERVAE